MPVQVVAGIIEHSDGRVLLAQRPAGKHLAGLWEFPGGKIENGESPDQALVRELVEELNLEVSIREMIGQFEYRYDWGPMVLHVFVVRAISEAKASAEVATFNWVPVHEVASYSLAPADLKPWSVYLDQKAQSGPTTESV